MKKKTSCAGPDVPNITYWDTSDDLNVKGSSVVLNLLGDTRRGQNERSEWKEVREGGVEVTPEKNRETRPVWGLEREEDRWGDGQWRVKGEDQTDIEGKQ